MGWGMRGKRQRGTAGNKLSCAATRIWGREGRRLQNMGSRRREFGKVRAITAVTVVAEICSYLVTQLKKNFSHIYTQIIWFHDLSIYSTACQWKLFSMTGT